MVANRRQELEAFVEAHPGDAFGRYGLAMEKMRTGEREAALEEFGRLREMHPEYAAGYQQAGQLLISLERGDEARRVLEAGIAVAEGKGDRHAAQEMAGLLGELG